MRYIVTKVDEGYEFIHLEEKQTLNGETVEVIKGKNVLTEEKINEAIKGLEDRKEELTKRLSDEEINKLLDDYKEQHNGEIDLITDQLKTLHTFIEEINKVK